MADKTSIEWCSTFHEDGTVTPGSTWNPIRGQNARHTCARISPGCDNCYAATMTRRGLMGTAAIDYGAGETPNDPARLDEAALLQPLRWKKPRKVFVCSMTDLFGAWVPDAWIMRIFGVMLLARRHTFIVLTKRPTRMRDVLRAWETRDLKRGAIDALLPGRLDTGINNIASRLPAEHQEMLRQLAEPILPNVWAGVSIESDRYAWRANVLREVPAAVRWISAEPLLGGLPSLDLAGIDWLVAGGESGPGARPMHPAWPRDLRDLCREAGVAFFFKQHGEWASRHDVEAFKDIPSRSIGPERCRLVSLDGTSVKLAGEGGMREGDELAMRVGNHRSGRLLDGRTWDQFPTVLAGAAS